MEKRTLSISQVSAGMRLAEPVTNANGITLMPAGIRLTPLFINRLKKWGIETLEVVAEKARETQSAPAPTRSTTSRTVSLTAEQEEFARSIATEVSRWFVNVRNDELMMQLRSVVIKRLVAHGRRGFINLLRRKPDADAEGNA